VHLQVLVDQFGERHRPGAPAGPESCEHLLESLQRVSASREPANLLFGFLVQTDLLRVERAVGMEPFTELSRRHSRS
jgi:hypothetical protein